MDKQKLFNLDLDDLMVTDLLEYMHSIDATDLFIVSGNPPVFRVDGELFIEKKLPKLGPMDSKRLIYSLLKENQRKKFEKELELDLSFSYKGYGRFRANVYLQKGTLSCAIRLLPNKIIPLEYLGLPSKIEHFIEKSSGLILVTGATGSGKSTTLASFIDRINEKYARHIITVEDPIEYVHVNKKSVIEQREVHADTLSFHNALKYILRQNPDVVVIGEMRDAETVEAALNIADTGHLTFATLHTSNAAQTINRIIDIFRADKQAQIRTQLSFVLEGIICQKLIAKQHTRGRVLACEVMMVTPGIRNMIRTQKVEQIYSEIQVSSKYGSQTLNESLVNLYMRGLISYQRAKAYADPDRLEELERMLEEVRNIRIDRTKRPAVAKRQAQAVPPESAYKETKKSKEQDATQPPKKLSLNQSTRGELPIDKENKEKNAEGSQVIKIEPKRIKKITNSGKEKEK